MPAVPNFLFIGPDKSGSSWLYEALQAHPKVYLPDVKELFFFDLYYDNGWQWYQKYFKDVGRNVTAIGEISHDYLFSGEACQRIKRDLPSVKLIVCLREPVQRAFSAYLYMVKQGRVACDFDAAIQRVDELIDHGLYAQHLEKYLNVFGRNRIHVAIFDDLVDDPQRFFDRVCVFLGIERMILSPDLCNNVLAAAKPRSFVVARLARTIGWKMRQMGMPNLVTKVKKARLINRILYSRYRTEDKPKISIWARNYLMGVFGADVRRLDQRLGLNLSARWGYQNAECIIDKETTVDDT
jgi:hypothetical protein